MILGKQQQKVEFKTFRGTRNLQFYCEDGVFKTFAEM